MSKWIDQVDHTWPYQWHSDRILGLKEVFDMLDWGVEHCCDEIVSTSDDQIWYFRNKDDCLLFTLRWSDK